MHAKLRTIKRSLSFGKATTPFFVSLFWPPTINFTRNCQNLVEYFNNNQSTLFTYLFIYLKNGTPKFDEVWKTMEVILGFIERCMNHFKRQSTVVESIIKIIIIIYTIIIIHNLQSVKNQEKNKRHRKRSLMFLTMILNKINRHWVLITDAVVDNSITWFRGFGKLTSRSCAND